MKKIILALVALSFLISASVFAEDTKKDEVPVMSKSMGVKVSGMEKMCCSMMAKPQMVATDEGGVIVLAGNKLMKYNADLDLVKEVEVKMPMGPMGGKQCPMMGKMMEKKAAPSVDEPQEKVAS